MSILEKLSKIQDMPAQYIYVLIVVSILIPSLKPWGLPISISPNTEDMYNVVSSLPEGSIVWVAYDVGFGTMPEMYAGTVAVLQHLFNLPVKIIITNLGVMGQDVAQMALGEIDKSGKEYGVDYIHYGWVDGGELYVAAFAENPHGLREEDVLGNKLEDLPLFEEIHSAADIDLIVEFCVGPQFFFYLRQVNAPYDTDMVIGVVAYIYAEVMPYYTSGQFTGYYVGARGAAEYELLTGKPGRAVMTADALSALYIWIVAVIIIGNVAYLLNKMKGGGEE